MKERHAPNPAFFAFFATFATSATTSTASAAFSTFPAAVAIFAPIATPLTRSWRLYPAVVAGLRHRQSLPRVLGEKPVEEVFEGRVGLFRGGAGRGVRGGGWGQETNSSSLERTKTSLFVWGMLPACPVVINNSAWIDERLGVTSWITILSTTNHPCVISYKHSSRRPRSFLSGQAQPGPHDAPHSSSVQLLRYLLPNQLRM